MARDNLAVSILSESGQRHRCRPYHYEAIEGDDYKANISQLTYHKGRRQTQTYKIEITPPILIFLKLTKGKVLNKPPIFIMKGRRIGEIKDIRAFRSCHKSDIWNHPNLTGYIDLKSHLEPTLARNDFKNTQKSRAIFNELIELEPLIEAFIEDINKRSAQRHYKALEDYLNKALSKLAKSDAMRFRTDYVDGDDLSLKQSETHSGDTVLQLFPDEQEIEKQNAETPDDEPGNDEGKEQPGETDIPADEPEGAEYEENNVTRPDATGTRQAQSGFNIRIVERDPDINIITNQPEKSRLIDDTIEIFRKHPEFMARVYVNRKGEQLITQRLITYLAGEITVHYKDKFHSRHGPPAYGKHLFSDLVNFIYRFEDLLKDLNDRNLSDIES